ncbi:hypothetical protein ACFWIA_12850 [Streptomyces sp. NPDC127068]|uniref:hypothetical protein n=1 Tax=Streptomyces sp. NPDC127068 TaxID=3347127 RepID=UPI00364CB9E7
MNSLLATRHRLGLTGAVAAHQVTARIVDRLDLSPAPIRDISRTGCVILNFPAT